MFFCVNHSCASHHTVHEDEFELVFVEGLVAVLVIGCPDVAGDGGCHSSVSVSVTGVRQEGTFVIQQTGWENIIQNMFLFDQNDPFMMTNLQKAAKNMHRYVCLLVST